MKLSEFIDSINANNDGFTMSAIVDLDSGADNPNAKYVLERNGVTIGEYDNSIKAKEGYEAAKQLLASEGFIPVNETIPEEVEEAIGEETEEEIEPDKVAEVMEAEIAESETEEAEENEEETYDPEEVE